MEFLVSVVIPTYKRHAAVLRAVKSTLNQTLPPFEIIIVNDGSDAKKRDLLFSLNNKKIKFFEAPARRSASSTRNYGINQAKGEWVALLDDDDVWLPTKLEKQASLLSKNNFGNFIVGGLERVLDQNGHRHIRPSLLPPPNTPMDQILFCGFGGVHISTLVAPTSLFQKFTFNENLERHEDWQWLLEASQEANFTLVPEILCSRNLCRGEGLSKPGNFEYSKNWYKKVKLLMTPNGRAGFVANILSRKAAHDHSISNLPWIINEILSTKIFNISYFVKLFIPWIFPVRIRGIIKSLGKRYGRT